MKSIGLFRNKVNKNSTTEDYIIPSVNELNKLKEAFDIKGVKTTFKK